MTTFGYSIIGNKLKNLIDYALGKDLSEPDKDPPLIKTVYKITLVAGAVDGTLILDDVEEVGAKVKELLKECVEGDEINIVKAEMSKEEYKNLPEFDEW